MFNTAEQGWRKEIIFYSIAGMLIGLQASRVLLSVTLILFIIFSLAHKNIGKQVKHFFANPVFWSMSLLFFLPLVSGLWSSNINDWAGIVRVKLPLLFLPLAFAGDMKQTNRDWLRIAFIFLITIMAGTAWSFFQYISSAGVINESYLKGKSIITPLGNDHVRFSWLVSIAVLLCAWILKERKVKLKAVRAMLVISMVWMSIYLHILAARTGLLCFYVISVIGIVMFLLKQKKKLVTAGIIALCISVPIIAWFTLPTFQNKIRYFIYDYSFAGKHIYLPGSSDGARLFSIRAGWNILIENPVAGVGFGDIYSSAVNWCDKNYPGMLPADKLSPCSEWMMYGAGTGWPGFIILSVILLYLFFAVKNPWWRLLNFITMLSYVFDMGLEVQYGVFLFAFIYLWWYSWILSPKIYS
ncbi:MAG: O-antigen ligase family protein [Bacteroidetes bacterium]|nr:O-antigen ligase family protein [Bacteroidota bacterium]